jgi:glycosyltransferase involved in cell wall biosynthesis
MKKILIFSLSYLGNFPSGAESAIKEVTDRINDIEFHIITNRYKTELPAYEKISNVHVHRIGLHSRSPVLEDFRKLPLHLNKPLFQFLAPLYGLWLHRTYKFDAVWSMMAHSAGVPGAIFKLLAPRVGFILTLQEGDPPEKVERTMRPLWPFFSRAFTLADVVQPISNFLADWAKSRGVPESKIVLVYNGANPKNLAEDFSIEKAKAEALRFGKKPGDIFLLNSSRLVHQKANDDTIRALALLPENVHAVFIGDGEDETILRELTKSLALESRVHFLGRMERSEVPTYRNPYFADIYVTPSRSEGLQLSSLSAMAARLPLIATQVGGLIEYVWDPIRNPGKPKTAWVVDPDSPEQIAAAVMDIMAHPEEARQIAESNRAMVFETYNWDVIAKRMRLEVFERAFKKV